MNKNKIKQAFANILIYVFLQTIIMYILSKINYPKNNLFLNFYNLIPIILTSFILIFLNKDLFKDKFKDYKDNYKKYLPLMLKYYICGFLLMNITSIILLFITKNIPANEEANRELLKILPIYTSINAVILGPICEEIAFRGIFKEAFSKKCVYLLLTSFIFGFAHVIFNFDLINIFPYMSLGYFLALTYYETDNILCSISIHIFHNLICILLLL